MPLKEGIKCSMQQTKNCSGHQISGHSSRGSNFRFTSQYYYKKGIIQAGNDPSNCGMGRGMRKVFVLLRMYFQM